MIGFSVTQDKRSRIDPCSQKEANHSCGELATVTMIITQAQTPAQKVVAYYKKKKKNCQYY